MAVLNVGGSPLIAATSRFGPLLFAGRCSPLTVEA
jgi:hypothetical protein